jgi:4-alpha-glucanotransferase
MGDLLMYMAADSADVCANKHIFRMNDTGTQSVHAGVPPDAFSKVGQDWGNPLYDWEVLKDDGYGWWLRRIRQCAERFDILRIDHFRGLSEYYAIPEGGDPKEGCWQHSAGLRFLADMRGLLRAEGFGMKLLVEDLGHLDAGVKNLLKLSGLPGMDIWQFTADHMKEMCDKEPEKAKNRAFYTGTHDNNTLVGYLKERSGNSYRDYDHAESDSSEMGSTVEGLAVIRKIYESPAVLAMLQVQDILMLGEEARMNVPGVPEGNWKWKMPGSNVEEAFMDADQRLKWFRALAERTGRMDSRNGASK